MIDRDIHLRCYGESHSSRMVSKASKPERGNFEMGPFHDRSMVFKGFGKMKTY